ncbi:MAG: alpha-hydroxy acid oxidase, partial [Pseudomonadota bacterium]
MGLNACHNFQDFRRLAKRRLPGPIFHYIDGAADDEQTYQRNTAAYGDCDLVPNVLAGVEKVDMSVEVMGQKLDMPLYCAPTALQRLFHHDGERAVAKAAKKFGTMFGVSSLGTVSVEEVRELTDGPTMFQFYFHKDRGLNDALLERAKAANFNVMALTVDTITGGNRERDLRTGFTSPPKLTPSSLLSFALHPMWAINYFTHPKFDLPHLSNHVDAGTNLATSIGSYFSTMLDQSMNWKDAE